MNWKNPDEELPKLAQRVLVETEQGSMLYARRVVRSDNIQQYQWLDDTSCPIHSKVVRWTIPE